MLHAPDDSQQGLCEYFIIIEQKKKNKNRHYSHATNYTTESFRCIIHPSFRYSLRYPFLAILIHRASLIYYQLKVFIIRIRVRESV